MRGYLSHRYRVDFVNGPGSVVKNQQVQQVAQLGLEEK